MQTKLVSIGAMLIFWLLVGPTLIALGMQLGLRQTELSIAGPFPTETTPPTHALMLTIPGEDALPWWRKPLIGDSVNKPFESRLNLKINGISVGPAHAQHAFIRAGMGKGFSHWGSRVIFSLPPGVENTANTTVVLQYAVEPRAWVTLVLFVTTSVLGWLLYRERLRPYLSPHRIARHANVALEVFYLILLVLCCFGLIGFAAFLITSAYAFASGWAFPTTALIRWWPVAQWAAANEPYFPYSLLTLSGLGVAATWLTSFGRTGEPQFERSEARLQRILTWAGLPIAISAFIFCLSAMWSGQVRSGDLESSGIGGLIPFSDAFGYFAAAYDQAKDGNFSSFSMRRPYAASVRTILLFFGQYSLPGMLLLQACLLGAAAWWASCAVMAWRGVWAGLGFFGLVYIYARTFASTTLTEPLGLFWALLSIPFFIASFRTSSVRAALIAFALTLLALMTRMGNMFAIPALMLWLVWQFGRGMAAKARIGALSVGILLAALGLNSLLQKAYGTSGGSTGSNFSYTLCGLTLGTTWDGCPKKITEARGPDAPGLSEQALVAQMYAMAWDNFRTHPTVFLQRLSDAVREFYSRFSEAIWRGYLLAVEEPGWFPRRSLVLLIVIGLCFVAARKANSIELSFWALFCASLTASAAIVFFDDGTRVLAASHPLVALLLATGLTNLRLEQPPAPNVTRLTLYGASGLLLAAVLIVTIPWIAHQLSLPAEANSASSPGTEENLVYGGKRMSGFFVVADGEPLRSDVPSIHMSSFSAIMELSGIEEVYQGLVNPVAPPLPFGFVAAPRMERNVTTSRLYIVPAEVLERRDVPAWRFQTAPWQYKKDVKGSYWVNVTAASPLALPKGK